MRFLLLFFFGIISITSGCQTNRVMMGTGQSPAGSVPVTRQVLMHDSQGPQATRVTMTAAEAAAFRRQ
ncbi:hypothetical protein GCM10022408_13590 [Hymenobacter fastidiosus]|uniref:Uncharacterized protein n=1 Tax=Hymenobacter fastidiosus TaxID=486264 RepID=A0ABP7RWT8_9BACT